MKNCIKTRIVSLVGIIALVAVIGFSMAACGDDEIKPHSGTQWNGDYFYWQSEDQKSVLNLTAKTITGGRDGTNSYDTYDSDLLIENVSIGTVTTLPKVTSSGVDFVARWAYVYEGEDKIGVISSETATSPSYNTSSYARSDYELYVGNDSSHFSYILNTPRWDGKINVDLSDLVDIDVRIRATKKHGY